mmetsp:Transcript_23605/g.52316  ORF Transcript_23605/g.52316 Transcript_23605/m.52316 type:complete len:247 (+) Transcript_23605:38-778(+)|eukprot:CAMPEP_0170577768 /NCGR_PEP_ID=MMETSP0224-20130122/5104_1 /TAXON_ID=285029 /ORGANISM="Togula jolla, Strain CCCM 725" /LENGTH=246 /DNA_ID=CAMNT_0010900703 /DNA_START=36 /DNA_END=776 /DNA_ORIENTATION=-
MVRFVGLTGPIACGKSAVAERLVASGIPVVDADKVTHRLYADRTSRLHRRVVSQFGEGILGKDGFVDRAKLGEAVFGDPIKMKALNKASSGPILGALVREAWSLSLKGYRLIALDIPLLAKFPLSRRLLAATIVVVAPPPVQLQRLMARNGLSEEDALKRIRSQASVEEQERMADFVVRNTGSLDDLEQEVKGLVGQLPSGWTLHENLLVAGVVAASFAALGALAVKGAFSHAGSLIVGGTHSSSL